MSVGEVFRRKNVSLHIVVDVGSHSLRGVVFETPSLSMLPRILKKKIFTFPSLHDDGEKTPLRIVLKLADFVEEIIKESGYSIKKITIGIGASIAEMSTATWTIKPTGIGKFITTADMRGYFSSLKQQKLDPGKKTHASILDIFTNGYQRILQESIQRTHVASLDFKVLLLSFSDEVRALLDHIEERFGGIETSFLPLIVAEKEAITAGVGVKNIFLVDIGGEETTLAYIHDGSIAQVASFSLGERYFIQGIARIAGVSFEEVEDIKRQYIHDLVGNPQKIQLHNFLTQESKLWKKMLIESLDVFYTSGPMPPQVLVCGSGAHLPEILSVLRGGEWIHDFSYIDYPKVNVLSADTVFQGNSLGGCFQGPEDLGLSSLVFYRSYTNEFL